MVHSLKQTRPAKAIVNSLTLRGVAIVLGCTGLALVLLLNSLSLVLMRVSPPTALALWPFNGMARERTTMINMALLTMQGATPQAAAEAQAANAARAYAHDPLSTSALAVIALAREPGPRQDAVIDRAAQLDRRNITLQGLLLQQQLARMQFDPLIGTLDRILRVHENQRAAIFPVLEQALADPRAVPAFIRILDGDQDWQTGFLRSAALKPELTENLVEIRLKAEVADREFNRRLIRQLANRGNYETAYRLYRLDPEAKVPGDRLGWQAKFAPFDWSLASDTNFRAQPDYENRKLEVYAASAHNGVVAKRVLPLTAPFVLSFSAAEVPEAGRSGITLKVRCAGTTPVLLEGGVANGINRFAVPATGEDCRFHEVVFVVRAAVGEPAVDAALGPIQVEKAAQPSRAV